MAAEKGRSLKRRNIVFQLPVYHQKSGEVLGHLVDITTSGLKLVSTTPIESSRLFRLRMELPEDYFKQRALNFMARSRWTRPDVNPELSVTGLTMEGLDDEGKEVISGLVDLFGFND